MNNLMRVKKSIEYIEEHLREDISLDDLAELCHVSRYHFHRVFQTVTASTVMKYIKGRRLSCAYIDLTNTDKRVIDIAFDYGFQSQESFSRAFKDMFQIPPGMLRRSDNNAIFFNRFDNFTKRKSMSPIKIDEPVIVCLKSFQVLGKEFHTDLDQLFEKSPQYWNEFEHDLSKSEELSGIKDRIVLYEYNPENLINDVPDFKYIPGIKKDEWNHVPENLSLFDVPEARYLVFKHKGGQDTLYKTYEYIDDVWIPDSQYELTGKYDFELYDPKNRKSDGYQQIDLYIAIK